MTAHASVRSRQILYVAGFDPRGAAPYHTMTRDGLLAHARAQGFDAKVSARKSVGRDESTWTLSVTSSQGGAVSETTFRYLHWDGLVRQLWIKGVARSILSGTRAYLTLRRLGVVRHALAVSWPIGIAMASPAAGLAATVALLICLGAILILAIWHPLAASAALALWAATAWIVRALLARLNTLWVSRYLTFACALIDGRATRAWTGRDAMAAKIVAAARDPSMDETLLIAHSAGTPIAILALARALELDRSAIEDAAAAGRLSIVTLGQLIPMVAHNQPEIHAALGIIASSSVTWLDVSAPPDPACYAMVDPVRDTLGGEPRVHPFNARFHKAFAAKTYAEARQDRFTMHFLYLRHPDGDASAGFNLYSLMTSPKPLPATLPARPAPRAPHFARHGAK